MLKKEEVRHIAQLARINLSGGDVERYQKDLSAILEYFVQLQNVNTEQVDATGYRTAEDLVPRIDSASDFGSDGKAAILEQSPSRRNGHVEVKSVF